MVVAGDGDDGVACGVGRWHASCTGGELAGGKLGSVGWHACLPEGLPGIGTRPEILGFRQSLFPTP